jgi:hypothetical protein
VKLAKTSLGGYKPAVNAQTITHTQRVAGKVILVTGRLGYWAGSSTAAGQARRDVDLRRR